MKRKLTWQQAEQLIAENTEEIVSDELVSDPVVSVSVVTYNHEKYIRQALDSVLDQETDFPFEIVIGEDCSSDGTGEIVRAYQKSHPDKIRLFCSTSRLGQYTGNGRLNLVRGLSSARGQYVALLEGDDYWCCSSKLNDQVKRFKRDERIALLCHRVRRINEQGYNAERPDDEKFVEDLFPAHTDETNLTWRSFFVRHEAQTCSVMFSRRYVQGLPSWALNLPVADTPICIFAASLGKVVYEPEVRAVYRRHASSYWSSTGMDFRLPAIRETGVAAFLATVRNNQDLNGRELWDVLRGRLCNGSLSDLNALRVAIATVGYVPAGRRMQYLRGVFSWYRVRWEERVPMLRKLPDLGSFKWRGHREHS